MFANSKHVVGDQIRLLLEMLQQNSNGQGQNKNRDFLSGLETEISLHLIPNAGFWMMRKRENDKNRNKKKGNNKSEELHLFRAWDRQYEASSFLLLGLSASTARPG